MIIGPALYVTKGLLQGKIIISLAFPATHKDCLDAINHIGVYDEVYCSEMVIGYINDCGEFLNEFEYRNYVEHLED